MVTSINRTLSRRLFLKSIGVGATSLALAACIAPQAGESGAAPATATTELDVLVCCYAPPDLEVRNKVNSEFEQANGGIKLNQELLPGGQNYFEKLQTLIAGNTPPDVFDMWEGYVQPYAKNGALLNLDPLLETDPKVKKENLLPIAVDGASWDNHLYALMLGFIPGPVSLYYNTAHFEKVGIAAPTSDWKWDDLRNAAKDLTQDSNSDGEPEQWGAAFDLWFVPWLHWIWSNGGDIFNPEQTACTLSEPAAVEALQYWADLVNVDKVAISPSALASMQGGLSAFQSGLVSMYIGNAWDVGTLKSNKELQWKAVLTPTANSGKRAWYTHFQCWAISAQTKAPEKAWSYIRDFVLNYEPAIQEIAPTIPSIKELVPAFDNPTTQELGYQPLLELVTQPGIMRIPGAGDRWDKISGLIQSELDLLFIGEKSAADAAAAATITVNEELNRA
ncbi:MAG: sugar ABC transporter substrate-binding protein [Caldilineaceae bacterium]